MNERVVSLTDRGRALEWLSLGFGLWLIGGLVFAALAGDALIQLDAEKLVTRSGPLAFACSAVHLGAGVAIALGAVTLLREGHRLWFGTALAALSLALIERTVLVWLQPTHRSPHIADGLSLWSFGSVAELLLVVSVLQGIRELATREGRTIPLSIVGVVAAAAITRLALLSSFPLDERAYRNDALLPWARAGLAAVASVVSVGLLLLAIREASEVVRGQIWSGQPDAASPARAADWQRTAAGLDRFGAFLIAKLVISTAIVIPFAVLPLASALASAAMAAALLACRRVPDPPDARSGFTGAAAIIAACAIAELSALTSQGDPMLTGVVSWLGHLVAYVAVLRSIGRIGERLGDDTLIRRARLLGWMAVGGVGCAVPAGFMTVRGTGDLGAAIAAPIVVSAVVLAALLPSAILAREMARTLRGRFAEPPRATARVS